TQGRGENPARGGTQRSGCSCCTTRRLVDGARYRVLDAEWDFGDLRGTRPVRGCRPVDCHPSQCRPPLRRCGGKLRGLTSSVAAVFGTHAMEGRFHGKAGKRPWPVPLLWMSINGEPQRIDGL